VGKLVDGNLVEGFVYGLHAGPDAEVDANGSVIARFVYAAHRNVPDFMVENGTTYRIVTDRLGSPRLVVDVDTGAIAQAIDYDDRGNVTRDTNPGFQPFGFAGGLYDTDTRLVHFGAREYDAVTGRWMSKDPISFGGGDYNLYGYVLDDPVNLTDPSGLASSAGSPSSSIFNPNCPVFMDPTPDDPTVASDPPDFGNTRNPPGPDWGWYPPGTEVGSEDGGWYNPKTGESLHPDDSDHGPHYDYRRRWSPDPQHRKGGGYRLYPDGHVEAK
jgi:RHS repeat-associated protein